MKVLLLPLGTEGDVRPLVGLGKKLTASGWSVSAVSTPEFVTLFQRAGITCAGAGIPYMDWIAAHPDLYDGNSRALRLMREFLYEEFTLQHPVLQDVVPGNDLVLAAGLHFTGFLFSRRFGTEYRHIIHIPQFFPSDLYPPFGVSAMRLPGPVNRTLWFTAELFINSVIRHYSRRFGFDTATWGELQEKMILSVERVLVDRFLPTDVPTIEYPVYDDGSALPREVEDFVSGTGKIVYVNFGSMPAAYLDRVLDALDGKGSDPGYRILVRIGAAAPTPWGDGRLSPENLLYRGSLPHAKLLSGVSCIVHHGGAGTVLEAARAGIPQIVIPHLGDQHFWARVTADLGLGPEPVPPQAIGKKLLPAVLKALDGSYADRCKEIRDRILERRPDETVFRFPGIDSPV